MTTKTKSYFAAVDSPFRLFLMVSLSVFAAELLVMLFIDALPPLSKWSAALIDSSLLLVSIFPMLYLTLFRPLTAQIRQREIAESALRQEVEKSQALLRNASDGIHILDRSGNLVELSDSFCAMLGYRREEMLGMNASQWDARFSAAELATVIEKQFQQGIRSQFETCHRRKDGSVIDVEVSGFPLQFDGKTLLFNSSREITARKRAEEQVRKLAQAVEQSPESIVITNTVPEIEYVNEAFLRTTGYLREDVIGRNPRVLHSGKTPAESFRALWDALTDGKTWQGEFCNRRKDGSEYIEFAIISPIRQADGGITHYVAVKEDITERKRVAEELDQHRNHLEDLVRERTAALSLAKDAADAANRAKSNFLANMSHELRTPIHAIVGMTDIALHNTEDPAQVKRLSKVIAASRHLVGIVTEILDFSKLDAERITLAKRDFNLDDVFSNVVNLNRERASEKALELVIDVLPRLAKLALQGDPLRLGQILVNLTSNAIKFTASGSVIVSAQVLEETALDVLVRFSVADTGIGISKADQARIFTAFEQADGSISRQYGGTGLGLAISNRIAEAMGSHIDVESQVGIGSVFGFTSRFAKTERKVSPAHLESTLADHLGMAYANARILLAEDEPLNQEVLQQQFNLAGVTVELAWDGAEAVEMAKRANYDLILMDIRMPKVDGIEATIAIRALPGQKDVPIVALTANTFEEERQRCFDAGMNDILSKPSSAVELYEMLIKWLAKANG